MFRWVHKSYAHDLQELGFEPIRWLGVHAQFNLSEDDWNAFVSIYGDYPHLYEHPSEFGGEISEENE